jgi:ADP-heptose:LPS heptosyltransferase
MFILILQILMPTIMIRKNISPFLVRNKERIVLRWDKLMRNLRGYFLDIKVILAIPQLSHFANSKLKKDKDKLLIGILREGGIGDRMTLGAFATAVKRKSPNSHITAITNNSIDPLVRYPEIDKTILHHSTPWESVAKYHERRYDIFYDLKYIPKVTVNNKGLNGYQKGVDFYFAKYSHIYRGTHGHCIPETLGQLNKNSIDFLCECACLDGGQKDLSFPLIMQDYGIFGTLPFDRYITVNNGDFSGRGNKCWPTKNWIELAEKIIKSGLGIVQIGIERDEYIENCYDLRGKTNIYEAGAIIKNGMFHIDTEGGLVFIAKAVGKKSIVLFGPTYPNFFGLEKNINIRTTENICEPCCYFDRWYWTCHLSYKSCKAMETITPDQIFQEITKLFKMNLQ